MDKGEDGLFIGAEVAAEAEVNAGDGAVQGVGPQVLAPQGDHQLRLLGKQSDNGLCPHLADRREHRPHSYGNHDAVDQCLAAPPVQARPGVLGRHRRHGGEHGGGHQEEEADNLLHNPHCRGHIHPPAVGNGGDDQEGDLDKPILKGHGNADFQQDGQAGKAQVGLPQGDAQVLPAHPEQGQHHAAPLGNDSSQGRTHGSQGHGADEQPVQNHVDDPGGGHKVHGALGVPLPPEHAADHIIGRNEGDAGKADGEIAAGLAEGFGGGGEQGENALCRQQQQDCSPHGEEGKEGNGAADGFLCPPLVPGPHRPADGYGGSHGKAHDDHREHVGHLAAHGDGGDGVRPVVPPGDEEISQTVKGLQKAGEEIGEGKAQHILEYASLGEPVLHVVSSLRSIIFNYSMGLVRFSRVSFCLRRGIKHKTGAPKTALLLFLSTGCGFILLLRGSPRFW